MLVDAGIARKRHGATQSSGPVVWLRRVLDRRHRFSDQRELFRRAPVHALEPAARTWRSLRHGAGNLIVRGVSLDGQSVRAGDARGRPSADRS